MVLPRNAPYPVDESQSRILKFGEHKIIHPGEHRETYMWILTRRKLS